MTKTKTNQEAVHGDMTSQAAAGGEVTQSRGRGGGRWRRGASGWGMGATLALVLSAARVAEGQDGPQLVTLITGDRVLVTGKNHESVSILPGAGREKVNFVTQRAPLQRGRGQHLHVVPEDALPLIASDKLDPRLFDITELLEFQYDDAHRDTLPIIVTYGPSSGGGSVAAQPAPNARAIPGAVLGKNLSSIDAVAALATKTRARELWNSILSETPPPAGSAPGAVPARDRIRKVWLDGLLSPVLDQSVPQIGAPAAWARGYDGEGVVVAVLDGGVDTTHPDLIDAVVVTRDFTGTVDLDEDGHGTHVASIIAGTGAAAEGRYRGVAPGVQLLSGKVCEGSGCPTSSIIEGIQWAVVEEGARIVNMSLGGPDTAEIDPLEEAVATLTAEYGTLFVIAAGNSGQLGFGSIQSPGSSPAALTVGAVDRNDQIADFSSRGPTGERTIKPEVSAPGVEIVAARAAGTAAGTPLDDWYAALSGTSMATPHVTGAAAILLQQHPDWTATELKGALMASASYNPGATVYDQGGGRVDVAAAIDTTLSVDLQSVDLGLALWPHEDDTPLVRTVTYRNRGAATELVFEIDVRGPDGIRPPAEMFTVTPGRLSLPEGGTASVTLTANTSLPTSDGLYSGRLIASDGVGPAFSTPLVLQREVESYDVTLRHLDRRGQPTNDFSGIVQARDGDFIAIIQPTAETPGDVTLRLPLGHYALSTTIDVEEAEGEGTTAHFAAPNQVIEGERVIEFDARTAAPVTVSLEHPSASIASLVLTWQVAGISRSNFMSGISTYYSATLDPPDPDLFSFLTAEWIDTSVTPTALYKAGWTARDTLPSGTKIVPLEQLARIDSTYVAPLPPQPTNYVAVAPFPEGAEFITLIFEAPFELPLERTEFLYSGDDSMRWVRGLTMFGDGVSTFLSVPATYTPGQHSTIRWNEAPFSPMLLVDDGSSASAFRQGDTIGLAPAMYSDGEGYFVILDDEAHSVLYRDGELIAESQNASIEVDVAPEPAAYRFEVTHSQRAFQQSTEQRAVWTFGSAHVDASEAVALPLLSVRFQLPSKARGPDHAERVLDLPFDVAQLGCVTAPEVQTPVVAVSYDDGVTWEDAPVQRGNPGWIARLAPEAGVENVSLRASVSALDGSAVEQTLIRAFSVAAPQ